MKFRRFKLIVMASALGGAMGMACAQQASMDATGPLSTTPAGIKTATDIEGNAALTSETAVAGTPRQGSPGTQSGVAVTDTTRLGAGPSWTSASVSSQTFVPLSGAQLRALERYEALR